MYILFLLFSGIVFKLYESVFGFDRSLHAFVVAFIISILAFVVFNIVLYEKRLLNKSNKNELYRGIGYLVITCLFYSFAISRISITTIIALALLGQNLAVTIVDYFGMFNREKQVEKVVDAPGILLAVVGLILFLDSNVTIMEIFSLIVSFASGMTGFFATMCLFEEKEMAPVLNAKSRLSFSIFSVILAISVDAIFSSDFAKVSVMSGLIIALASLICNYTKVRYEIQKKMKLEYYNHIMEEENKHRDYIVSKWLETMDQK